MLAGRSLCSCLTHTLFSFSAPLLPLLTPRLLHTQCSIQWTRKRPRIPVLPLSLGSVEFDFVGDDAHWGDSVHMILAVPQHALLPLSVQRLDPPRRRRPVPAACPPTPLALAGWHPVCSTPSREVPPVAVRRASRRRASACHAPVCTAPARMSTSHSNLHPGSPRHSDKVRGAEAACGVLQAALVFREKLLLSF